MSGFNSAPSRCGTFILVCADADDAVADAAADDDK